MEEDKGVLVTFIILCQNFYYRIYLIEYSLAWNVCHATEFLEIKYFLANHTFLVHSKTSRISYMLIILKLKYYNKYSIVVKYPMVIL